jgi:hypothetical protein
MSLDARGILSRGRFPESTRGTYEWARIILARGRCNGRLWVAPAGAVQCVVTDGALRGVVTPGWLVAEIE